MKEKISFVIPCYRSEHTITAVVEEIHAVMAEHPEYTQEIILVNDCSPDNVWQVIQNLAETYEDVQGICLAKNFGQHAALMAGYRAAQGELIFSLDDDGQAPVDQTFDLIHKIQEGYDVVYGKYPAIRQSRFRIFGSWVNAKMAEILLGKPKGVDANSFYVMRRLVRDQMIQYQNPYPYLLGLVLQVTRKIADVEVNQRQRTEGTSGYTFASLIKLWMNGFTAFSVKPLRMATIAGTLCAVIGFLYGFYLILNKLIHQDAILLGYTSTMAVLLFVGGVIMVLLGIIGEYLGRIYICINNAPQYVIREHIGKAEQKCRS